MADTMIKLFHYKKYRYNYEDLNPKPRYTNYILEISYADGADQP